MNSSSYAVGELYKSYNNITKYFSLAKANDILSQENAFYRSQMKDAFVLNTGTFKLKEDTIRKRKYSYLAASVINNSVNKQKNFLTLDKGSIHGVKPDMGVIGPNGVVGIVKYVSENYASVISVLNTDVKISTKIKKNQFFGTLVWEGTDDNHALLNEIPIHAKIDVGDTLISSGYSTIFPEGILIGFIEKFSNEQGGNFYEIEVRLASEFRNLSHVYIINNLTKAEQKLLESRQIEEND